MNKTIISILVSGIIVLAGGLGVMAKDALDKKADNAVIMKMLDQRETQRLEDREDEREKDKLSWVKEQAQQEINQDMMRSIQKLLIQMAEDK